ncbi:hypothetical protein ACA910_020954 [Epithemia clementina (nom. ined.)]
MAFSSDKKDPFNHRPESLFSMAMYDVGTMKSSRKTVFTHPSQFYPVEEYKDLGLRDILELSEDCLFSDDEEELVNDFIEPLVPIPAAPPSAPLLASESSSNSSFFSSEDLEWSQLDDPPLMEIDCGEDIPVAAALVSSMEMPSDPECRSRCNNKRSRDMFLSDDGGDDEEQESSESSGIDAEDDRRFRPYQEGQWFEKFEELCAYRKEHGNCLVPHTYKQNLPLARWVKRQRYQYKLMKDGKPSTMTEERAKSLEDIDFVWDSQAAAWYERLSELRHYRSRFFHCNVPSNYNENPQLATWVKCQRRQYKLFMEGKPSNMTTHRIHELGRLGFEWELRSYKKQRVE